MSFSEQIANIAIKSMLYEVAVTPKPGLVDRNNPGAHKDMDFFTFLDSTSVLYSYYYDCTKAGEVFRGEDYTNLLKDIRPIGIKAEDNMFNATKGINTHKGMIFSLGILCAAAGSIYNQGNNGNINRIELSNRVKEMTVGLTEELKNPRDLDNLTYGEELYKKHKITGVRGQVESGFKTVLDIALPEFENLYEENKYHINDILVQVLLNLMAKTEDSNILGRHSIDILYHVKELAEKALSLGGIFTEFGKQYIEEMDKYFIEKHISSGGSADLLAVTLFIYILEKGDI